jgi:hypothetical protein
MISLYIKEDDIKDRLNRGRNSKTLENLSVTAPSFDIKLLRGVDNTLLLLDGCADHGC